VTDRETPARILIVDDEPDIRQLVRVFLELEGFEVHEAVDGVEGVARAIELRPDLILLDLMMPNKSGTEVLADLRRDYRTAYIPVVVLTAKALTRDKVQHLVGGADDYVVKPFEPDELTARVETALRRSTSLRGLNPLTGMPGNTVIADEIASRLTDRRAFACLYVDLDNFKAYNDTYGFTRGDEVIQALAAAILSAMEQAHAPDRFAGHVGGDDFVVLIDPPEALAMAEAIIASFDAVVPALYDSDARERGWVEVEDRRGNVVRVPLVSVSVGIVDSTVRAFDTPAQVAEIAAEMKGVAKQTPGSSFAVDRRRD
jgi:PleD family two-component response regulator